MYSPKRFCYSADSSVSLPKLIQDVNAKLVSAEADLALLPPTLTVAETLHKISEFCGDFKGTVYGKNDMRKLVQSNRKRYVEFQKAIRQTVPDFRPFEDPNGHKQVLGPEDLGDSEFISSSVEPLGVLDVRKVIEE